MIKLLSMLIALAGQAQPVPDRIVINTQSVPTTIELWYRPWATNEVWAFMETSDWTKWYGCETTFYFDRSNRTTAVMVQTGMATNQMFIKPFRQ